MKNTSFVQTKTPLFPHKCFLDITIIEEVDSKLEIIIFKPAVVFWI